MSGAVRIVGVVQPTYLPWLPFFERMAAADVFVLLDDVAFSKNASFNRNAVKTAQGRTMLTVPVLHSGASGARLDAVAVDRTRGWARKHWLTISQAYGKAPYWPQYKDALADYFLRDHGPALIDWTLPMIHLLRDAFGLTVPFVRSSAMGVETRRNEKLADICKALGGTHFIVKPGTESYHPPEEFIPHGVGFAYLEYTRFEYPQLGGAFEPGLSALDYLLNCGPGRPPFAARARTA
jgi:hypothetical protein